MEFRSSDPNRLDQTLRDHLEPNPLTVERLVRTALREGNPSPAVGWPRLALATAVTVAMTVVLVMTLLPVKPSPSVASGQPARISISNPDGFVTISSMAGSKWILYSGDDS